MKLIEIFKPGKQTAMSGQVVDFSEADLQAAAAAYDPALHEAPLVVGHPKDNGPAYGWVKSIVFQEGKALAIEPDQVDAQFAELVNEGKFKRVSASWYLPDSPANPKPGVLYLRHVGFLGAQPPAVKGLKPASFAEAEEGVVEFADWGFTSTKTIFQRLRDWLIDREGLDTADKLIPQWELDAVAEAARAPELSTSVSGNGLNYQEGASSMTPEQLKARSDELDARQAGLDTRETSLQQREAAARTKDITSFCEGLVAKGKLLPAQLKRTVAFMESLPEAAQVIEFGEGDAKTETPAAKVFREFLEAMPTQVTFGEVAGANKGVVTVDMEDPQAIANAALEFQESEAKAGRVIDVAAAVKHITTQQGAQQ